MLRCLITSSALGLAALPAAAGDPAAADTWLLTGARVLDLLPQQEPFRFVDEILEMDDDHIVARYTFRPDADFYRGHFPGNPITPGVLLIEAMAQLPQLLRRWISQAA